MRTLFLFLPFLFCTPLFAQNSRDNGLQMLEQLDIDSLEIRNPIDTLNQGFVNSKEKLQGLKNSLNDSIDFPDTFLHNVTPSKINQTSDAAHQKVNAAADSLKQKLHAIVPDSLKTLIPKEVGVLEDVGVREFDVRPLEELKGINEINQLGPLKKIENIRNSGDLETFPELEQIGTITDQLREVKEGVIETDKIGETIESEAKNLKGISVLEQQKGELEGAIPDFDRLRDSDHYKEELINTAKEKAVDHFAGHADKLQAAQSKLADIKRKYPEGVSSIKDLPKIQRNGMKGKPFKERLVMGLTVQIHPDKIPNVDLSPFAAYKISKRLSVGMGGSYRIMAKPEFKGFTSEGAVYGYRGFTEVMLHKGIFVHAEYELLKTQVRDSIMFNTSETILEKEWVDGLLIGIGKEYTIGGIVKGNMQVLYNLLDEANSPYQNKVMVRFGFSFQLKDNINKPDSTMGVDRLKGKGNRSSRQLVEKGLSGS